MTGYTIWNAPSDLDYYQQGEVNPNTCDYCNGRGRIYCDPVYEMCPECRGNGEIVDEDPEPLDIDDDLDDDGNLPPVPEPEDDSTILTDADLPF